MVKLKDFCTINPKAPVLADDLEVSFVPMPKVGEQGEFEPSEIKEYREVKKGFTNFQNGDVLFAKITPCMENGKGAIAKNLKNGYGFGSTEFHILRPDYSKGTSEWLYYLTRWEEFRNEAKSNMTGSAGQKRVPKTFLENYEVKLPGLEKQKEIANTLKHIGNLITLRKQQLTKLDLLVKARFVEMFGDPAGNPMGWPTQTMKNASIRLSDGPFGSNLKSSHYTAEGVRVIRLGNIGCGCFNDADRSFVPQEHYEKLKKYTCRAGEIVIATLGDPNLRACIIPDYIGLGINKSDCVHYIPKPNLLNNQFVCQYINCPETLVLASGMVHGQTRSRISSGQLADLPIFLPPIELQNQFAAFIEQVGKSKSTIQQSLEKLELLKKSLMQAYFG